MAEVAGEDGTPRVIPEVDGLYDLGVAGGEVETELACRQDRAAVELGDSCCQILRLRGLFSCLTINILLALDMNGRY